MNFLIPGRRTMIYLDFYYVVATITAAAVITMVFIIIFFLSCNTFNLQVIWKHFAMKELRCKQAHIIRLAKLKAEAAPQYPAPPQSGPVYHPPAPIIIFHPPAPTLPAPAPAIPAPAPALLAPAPGPAQPAQGQGQPAAPGGHPPAPQVPQA